MDPDENLKQQRELARLITDGPEDNMPLDSDDLYDYAVELAGLVQALDRWLSKGGFKPTDWGETHPQSLEELFAALKDGTIELAVDLPVFADADWNNPVGVWSWDYENMIFGTCLDDIQIVRRPNN